MEEQTSPVVTLTLDVNAVNFILELIAQRPYAEVAQLIAGIHQQVQPQLFAQEVQKETEGE